MVQLCYMLKRITAKPVICSILKTSEIDFLHSYEVVNIEQNV